MELSQTEQQKSKKNEQKSEDSLKDVWDNIKWTNVHIIGIPGKEETNG